MLYKNNLVKVRTKGEHGDEAAIFDIDDVTSMSSDNQITELVLLSGKTYTIYAGLDDTLRLLGVASDEVRDYMHPKEEW